MKLYRYGAHITFSASVMVDEWLLFSCNMFNGLFKYNLFTKELIYLGMFDNENALAINLHQKAIRWRDKVIFVPKVARELCIYDIPTGKLEYVKLHNWEKAQGIFCHLEGDDLWIFYVLKNHFALKINLESGNVTEIHSPESNTFSDSYKTRKTAFFGNLACSNKRMYLPLWLDENIICVDTCSEAYDIVRIDMDGLRLTSIAICDRDIFFSSFKDWNIYRYDMDTKAISVYKGEPLGDTAKGYYYPEMVVVDGRLLIFSEVGNQVLTLRDDKLVPLCEFPNGFGVVDNYECKKRRRFYGISIDDSCIVVPPYSTNMELEINVNTGELKSEEYLFDENYIEELFQKVYKPVYIKEQSGKPIVNEGRFFTLNDFIAGI